MIPNRPAFKNALPLLGACLLALVVAVLLTGWLSLGICLFGFAPETLMIGDFWAPLCALFLASWVLKRHVWRLSACAVLFWLAAWLLLTGRFSLVGWWHDGLGNLGYGHFFAWWMAIFIAELGGALGVRARGKGPLRAATALALCGLWGAQALASSGYRNVKSDALIFAREELDGTQVRLLSYDLGAIAAGIYDADSDDARPFDNRNASWLGQAMPLVWRKIERENGGETLCAVNGGFFGAEFPFIGFHEAPIVHSGVARYDSRALENDWPAQNCLLGWKRASGNLKFSIVEDARFADLSRQFDGALGGVRALIVNGQARELKPGMGGTTLKCSRTSVGWQANKFYILSVRDPDGEAASLRANKREKAGERNVQVGGWDARQVQQFWQEQGVENAVLFDGGESTQLAFRTSEGSVFHSHSSYHFTRTPFYINDKPLRFVLPMLPNFEANGGVLNYFWVSEDG